LPPAALVVLVAARVLCWNVSKLLAKDKNCACNAWNAVVSAVFAFDEEEEEALGL
jgi:hypothetical protein